MGLTHYSIYKIQEERSSGLGRSPGKRNGYPLQCPWASLGAFPIQGSNSGLPHCRKIVLPAEPLGKPKSAEVGSLSLLQHIFLTKKLNQVLLRCRRIVYQLSYW